LGKSQFAAPTGETDKARAKAVGAALIAGWRAEIETAKQKWLEQSNPYAVVDAAAAALAGNILGKKITNIAQDKLLKERGICQSSSFDAHVDDWIKVATGTQKSKHMKAATVRKFATKHKTTSVVTRPAVQQWLADQVAEGVSVATIRRSLSELRGYWSYLQSIQAASDENLPFERLVLPKADDEPKTFAFTPENAVSLVIKAIEIEDNELADIIRVAMFTGARLEEICTITVQNIQPDRIIVSGTKTATSLRQVPIHPQLDPTIRRLIGERKTGFLFPDLTENKFGDRSNAVGKRFGHMKTNMKFGSQYVFHSLRKTFSNILWSNHVQRELISQLLGHKTGHITTDVYTRDPEFATKLAAIEKLVYPRYEPA
jgi:integrase